MLERQQLLCRYRYDALDRLAAHEPANERDVRLFYRKQRLVTQIQGASSYSIFEAADQLLAQQQSSTESMSSTLLTTDRQRSVVGTLVDGQQQAQAYTAYGYQAADSALGSLLGFNGERRDPVTGCYLLGNGYRAFNPVLMRFISPDSLSPFGKGGLNSYAYCLGDPVNHLDPDGHFTLNGLQVLLGKLVVPSLITAGVLLTVGAGVAATTDDDMAGLVLIAAAGVFGGLSGIGVKWGVRPLTSPRPSVYSAANFSRQSGVHRPQSIRGRLSDSPPRYTQDMADRWAARGTRAVANTDGPPPPPYTPRSSTSSTTPQSSPPSYSELREAQIIDLRRMLARTGIGQVPPRPVALEIRGVSETTF